MTEESKVGLNGTIDLKKIQGSNTDAKVIEVYRLLKRFMDDPGRIKWVKDVYKRCWEVAWGDTDSLWSEDEHKQMIDKGQIPIAINDLAKGIQGSSAVATANKPGINVKPIGGSDLYLAEILKRGFDFVWGQNRAGMVLRDCVKEAKTGSLGVFDVKHDASKGEYGKIVILSDNPLDYYYDSKSRLTDKADSHIIKAHLITRVYAKENYDVTDDDLDFEPVKLDEEAGQSSAGKPGEDEYARMEDEGKPKDASISVDEEDKADVWEIEAWLIKQEKKYYLAVLTTEGKPEKFECESKAQADEKKKEITDLGGKAEVIMRKHENRVQRVIVGKKLISEETNPYGLDSDGDPVMPKILMGHDRSYSGYFVSPTYRAIEVSKSRNKRRIQSIAVISDNLNSPIVVSGNFTIEKGTDGHPDIIRMGKDAAFAPSRLPSGATATEAMNMEQRDAAAIDEEFDMNDVMKGKTPPGVEAFRAINALQEQAGMMSTPFIDVVEAAIEKVAKVAYSLMLRHWPRAMWQRLIDEEEMETWQPDKEKEYDEETGEAKDPIADEIRMKWETALERLCPSDPTQKANVDMEGLDIKIVVGSVKPTNREAKRVDAMDMVKAGIYDAEAALEYFDDPNKDKVAARMKQREKMMIEQGMTKGVK